VAHDQVELMVHEPFLEFGRGSWRQNTAAGIHRIMMVVLLNAASRVWVAIPAWKDRLKPYLLGRNMAAEWLPVPSNVEYEPRSAGGQSRTIANGEERIGHFGTYGRPISQILKDVIPHLLFGYRHRSLILMGRGSDEFRVRVVVDAPALTEQIHATGEISPSELSSWIQSCHVMVQPYPDGVSSRRGTAMAALSHGVPMVTTIDALTEDIWAPSGAVELSPTNDLRQLVHAVNKLLENEDKRRHMGYLARRLYMERFDVRHTIDALRGVAKPDLALCEF
jgi:glycosyltransferase involved in cell wall biosynthesis